MKRRRKLTRPLDRYPRGPALWVSEIVEQVYCETRVDLWLKDPGERISVPKQLEGKPLAAHQENLAEDGRNLHKEKTLGAIRITDDQLQKRIRTGKQTTILEMLLEGTHKGVSIIGRADAVCLTGRRATCAIDYKFTTARRLFPSVRLQLLVYGLLLQQRELVTDDLLLVAALANPRSGERASRNADAVTADAVSDAAQSLISRTTPIDGVWYGPGPGRLSDRPLALQVIRYESQAAAAELSTCLEYWLGERKAEPTSNRNRCKCCRYNQLKLCPFARAPFQSSDAF